MLTIYDAAEGMLIKHEGAAPITPAAVWIDLLNPTKDEDLLVERALSISVPTREEMSEIEASSRLYQEGGGHYMTAVVLHQPDPSSDPPVGTPITFILAGSRLVTVRYAEPRAFPMFLNRAQKKDAACMTGTAVMVEPPNVVAITETATVTGGTGRFAGATGSIEVERVFNRATGVTTGTLEGWISTADS